MNCFHRVKRLFAFAPGERKLLFEATALLFFLRLSFAVLPFRMVSGGLKPRGREGGPRTEASVEAANVSLAIARAVRIIPRATCLMRSLAGAMMLARRGYPARLCIGVHKRGKEFGAHAWVECDGGATIGSGAGFSKILVLPGVPS